MNAPRGAIFALGTASHAYLEFDLAAGADARDLVAAIASLREPRTTTGGVNLVAGFRPELWAAIVPDDAPPNIDTRPLTGAYYVVPSAAAVLRLEGAPP